MKLASTALLALCALAIPACTHKPQVTLPAEIQGHWVTKAPGYENRFLQLEPNFVLIGINLDETPSIQKVSRVESRSSGQETIYTIYSTSPDVNYQITLYFNPANGGELRVQNRGQVLWKRQDPASFQP
ncbi:MAG TPA: hypothetical protein VGF06_14765 [Terriglobales bacterium]